MESMNLFLDDERRPGAVSWVELPEGPWQIVRTYHEFTMWVAANGLPDFIAFDHDLGESPRTGYDCAKWLVEYCMDNELTLPPFAVHSKNPVGKENIESLLEGFRAR